MTRQERKQDCLKCTVPRAVGLVNPTQKTLFSATASHRRSPRQIVHYYIMLGIVAERLR
jgi:hypothetical protein